jgi:hypothetical protein
VTTTFEVELAEGDESNGAAYLVHMLLMQQGQADTTGRFALEARRLKPVRLSLHDTGEECSVAACPRGLRVTNDTTGCHPTSIRAESRHVIDVTQLRLAGRGLITGPVTDKKLWGLLRDLTGRRIVIEGLVSHYVNTMRFLWLINVRRKGSGT